MTTKKVIFISIALVIVSGFVGWAWQHESPAVVTFLDVGQGDAVHIRLAGGFDILIDGGPDDRVLQGLGKFMPFYDRQIEMIILTHAHADHVVGLDEVLERYAVDRVLYPGPIDYDNAPYRALLASLANKKIQLVAVHGGQRFNLPGESAFEILYPFADTPLVSPDINELSVVSTLTVQGKTFLFTGDAGSDVEDQLINAQLPLAVDVLKVGHHGSRGSTSERFIEAVTPAVAVISCGEGNWYGHPHPETIERLRAFGSTIYRTDQVGDVRCQVVHTEVKCSGHSRY